MNTGVFHLGQFRLRPTSFFYLGQLYSGQVLLRPSSTQANLFLGPEGWGPEERREQRRREPRGVAAQRCGSPHPEKVEGPKGGRPEEWGPQG